MEELAPEAQNVTERQKRVALLIDYDNLQICYSRDAPGTQLDMGAVLAFAQSYGRVVVARAYAEWGLLSERLNLWKHGIEPAFAPVMRPEGSNREGKSLCDTVMVADGIDLLWTMDVDVLVLVTSDKDMIPLARMARQRGALVVVLGSDLTAVQLIECANDFVTYRHLLVGMGRGDEKPPLATRVRAEPRARRARGDHEPAQREPAALAPPAHDGRPREARPREAVRRPRPVEAAIAAPPPIEEPAPVFPEAATIPSDLADGEPMTPRRRRRRGGRRRRGEGGEGGTPQEVLEAGFSELEGTPQDVDDLGDLGDIVGPVEEEEEEEAAAEVPIAEEPPPPTPLRTHRAEPRLKPWERWPEPAPAPARPTRASARNARAARPAQERLEPDFAVAPSEEPAAEAAPEDRSESLATVGDTELPVAVGEPPAGNGEVSGDAETLAPVASEAEALAEAASAEAAPAEAAPAEAAPAEAEPRPARRRTRRPARRKGEPLIEAAAEAPLAE